MLDWRLNVSDIHGVMEHCATIEKYSDESRLVLGHAGARPLHLVISEDDEMIFIITVYEPDPFRWDPSFRRRIET